MGRLVPLALALAVACLALPAAAGAVIPQSARYDVTLTGDVNGIAFQRTGAMAIGPTTTAVTTNGVNAVDVCLGSGSPFISPETGAIWFATNGVCVNANGARQDMAFVAADIAAGTIAIRPDPGISATGINGFNQSSGLTANVYQIFEGAIALQFPGNGATVTGTIDILGTGAIFHSEQRYRATLTGTANQLTPPAGGGPVQPPAGDIGSVSAPARSQKVGRRRTASVATVSCTTGPCTVTAPTGTKVKIGRKRYSVTVLRPGTIATGQRASVKVKLGRKAFKKLAGRSAIVTLKLGITARGQSVERTVTGTIRRPG